MLSKIASERKGAAFVLMTNGMTVIDQRVRTTNEPIKISWQKSTREIAYIPIDIPVESATYVPDQILPNRIH